MLAEGKQYSLFRDSLSERIQDNRSQAIRAVRAHRPPFLRPPRPIFSRARKKGKVTRAVYVSPPPISSLARSPKMLATLVAPALGFNVAFARSAVAPRAPAPAAKVSAPSGVASALADDPREFSKVIAAIEDNYEVSEVAFTVGELSSDPGQNMGSAKIFSLGKLLALDERDTLRCFGQYYDDVLATPDGDDHGNIRNFMKCGWKGVEFPSGLALTPKGAFEYAPAQEVY